MYKGGAAALVMPDPSCSLKLRDKLSKLWYTHIMDYWENNNIVKNDILMLKREFQMSF